jgi:hypothetical protein
MALKNAVESSKNVVFEADARFVKRLNSALHGLGLSTSLTHGNGSAIMISAFPPREMATADKATDAEMCNADTVTYLFSSRAMFHLSDLRNISISGSEGIEE